jgi:hypothetical protein
MKKILSLFCFAAVLVSSCNDEPKNQEPKDKVAPEITLTAPTQADFYQDGLLIQASATDDVAVTSLEAFIDETRVDSQTTGQISIVINTEQFEDGVHTLKIVGKDAAGNEAKVEKTINVLNYVIKLKLVVNKPQPNTKYFYYLLDESGAVVDDIVYQAVANSTEIKFSTPANHATSKKYAVGFFEHQGVDGIWPPQNRFYIVPGYTQGVYNESIGFRDIEKSNGGSHTINLQDFPGPVVAAFHTENWGSFPTFTNSLLLGLDKNGGNAYVAVMPDYNAAPRYKLLTGLTTSGTTNLTPNDFTAMDGVAIPGSDNSLYTFSFVYGMKTADSHIDPRIIWAYNISGILPDKKEFQMYYPGNYYPQYYSGLEEVLPDHYDQYFSFSPTPPMEFKRLDAHVTSVSQVDDVFNIKTDGTYDLLELHGGHNSTDGVSVNYLWTIALPANNDLTYRLPAVPQQLMQMFGIPPSTEWITPVDVTLNDFSGVSGYDDYFRETYANAPSEDPNYISWKIHSNEWILRSETFGQAGGRFRPQPSIKDAFNNRGRHR